LKLPNQGGLLRRLVKKNKKDNKMDKFDVIVIGAAAESRVTPIASTPPGVIL
jgi:hypothetical protein